MLVKGSPGDSEAEEYFTTFFNQTRKHKLIDGEKFYAQYVSHVFPMFRGIHTLMQLVAFLSQIGCNVYGIG